MRAPQSFFDETDADITLNRFSRDMTHIDGQLLPSAVIFFSSGFPFHISKISLMITVSYVPIPRAINTRRSWIKLHGSHLPCTDLCGLLPAKILPPHILTNAIPGFRMQKPSIYARRGNSWRSLNNPCIRLARSLQEDQLCTSRHFLKTILSIILYPKMAWAGVAASCCHNGCYCCCSGHKSHGHTSGSRLGVSLSQIVTFNSSLGFLLKF
jgi:hypothetical protein